MADDTNKYSPWVFRALLSNATAYKVDINAEVANKRAGWLLPYHVVADYEAEEDDRILDSDISAKPLSRSQQWDNNIYNKVAEFTATFEKQVFDFNDISRKQAIGEFRSEERLMVEQILLQEERRALYEARVELETRQKEGLEAQAASLRMAAIAQAEQLRAESQARAEMMATGPIRASAIRAHEFFDQEQEVNMDAMMNGWANNMQRYEKEPSEDFLNDEERDNGDMGIQSDWREGRGFDLNICPEGFTIMSTSTIFPPMGFIQCVEGNYKTVTHFNFGNMEKL
nr:hypothetical protein [Tanacetum cinerariifolium]